MYHYVDKFAHSSQQQLEIAKEAISSYDKQFQNINGHNEHTHYRWPYFEAYHYGSETPYFVYNLSENNCTYLHLDGGKQTHEWVEQTDKTILKLMGLFHTYRQEQLYNQLVFPGQNSGEKISCLAYTNVNAWELMLNLWAKNPQITIDKNMITTLGLTDQQPAIFT